LGGAIGAAATAALMIFAMPEALSSRIVRSGMMADPQILADTAEALRDQQYKPVLDANRAALERPFGNSWKGSANPDVTLVEFYDYACAYCKASNPHIERLLAEDKGLRVVYRELPILGQNSVVAARLALTASKKGKFREFHDTLWEAGTPAPDTLAKAAIAAGVGPLPQQDAVVENELKQNFRIASQLGATGTPVFVVGDRVMNGAVGYDALKRAIADTRAKRA
jgi:protein-disulfide isomerase